MLEPARRPFMQIVRKDKLPLVWQREADFATQIIMRDAYFRHCPPHTITDAVKNLVYIGLSLNPSRQHATIIPRYDRRSGSWSASPMVMYRGLMHLATEAGVHGLKAEVVYRGDHFRYGSSDERGGDWYEYELNPDAPRSMDTFRGVFVAARMPAGDLKIEWLTRTDIERIRQMSDSYLDDQGKPRPGSPWVKWFDEMAKKSGIKRASKHWEEMIGDSERWARFLDAIRLDNQNDALDADIAALDESTTPSAEPVVPCLTQDQITALNITSAALRKKICAAYNVTDLDQIPAAKFDEIKERLAAARAQKQQQQGAAK